MSFLFGLQPLYFLFVVSIASPRPATFLHFQAMRRRRAGSLLVAKPFLLSNLRGAATPQFFERPFEPHIGQIRLRETKRVRHNWRRPFLRAKDASLPDHHAYPGQGRERV
jgi:hypothetical protein